MKLLMENWRKFVNEQEGSKLDKVANVLANPGTPLAQYVAVLKRYAGDPAFETLASSGQSDGDADDEKVSIKRGSVPAQSLTATQAEIGFGNSLADQVTNNFGASARALSSKPIVMGSKDGDIPLLVWNGTHILDGHHRWSQVMMVNPTGDVVVDSISGPALDNEEEALKAMQMAIAVAADNVATKPFKGENLMAATPEQVATYVQKNITDEVLGLLAKAGKIEKPDRNLAAQYIAGNLDVIKGRKGQFSREKSMPQAGASGASQDVVNKLLGTGKVNFEDPNSDDALTARKLAPAGLKGTRTKFGGK